MTGARARRGGVLFEVLLSIALFVGAAVFTLGTTRTVLVALDRAGREAVAIDLARAKMAELDAGLVTMSELRESVEGIDRVGSVELLDRAGDRGVAWELSVETERSEFAGLTLVEITVAEPGDPEDPDRVHATLRQLVALRDESDEEYEEDEILLGLPTGEEGQDRP
jgi:hypothetical protein